MRLILAALALVSGSSQAFGSIEATQINQTFTAAASIGSSSQFASQTRTAFGDNYASVSRVIDLGAPAAAAASDAAQINAFAGNDLTITLFSSVNSTINQGGSAAAFAASAAYELRLWFSVLSSPETIRVVSELDGLQLIDANTLLPVSLVNDEALLPIGDYLLEAGMSNSAASPNFGNFNRRATTTIELPNASVISQVPEASSVITWALLGVAIGGAYWHRR